MPDLSSYIDFSVRFDLTDGVPKMILTDTSSYPSGVNEDITGYFSVTSPDMGTDSGSWSSPDVTWNGDELTTRELILRLNDKGNIQAGDYTVVYNVHHPSYTPTVLSRTFNTSYIAPTLNLVESFDVFTPELKYYDQTSYGIPGYSHTIDRYWEAYSTPTGWLVDTTSVFDMVYESEYYDAEYSIYLSVNVIYESDTYSYLSIEDIIIKTGTAFANTPPSIDDLVGYLNDLKDELDANVNNDSLYSEYKSRYEYASSLLFNIKESCRAGLLTPLSHYVSEFLSITNNFVTPPYTNTDEVIDPYDCGSAGAASTYRVYTALLTQSGGGNVVLFNGTNLTIGVTYLIESYINEPDFTNVGAPNNNIGTYFVATGTTPNNWADATLEYNIGAPVVTVLENTIGNIWFTYIGAGNYYVNSDALFNADKTYPLFGGFYNGENWICIYGNTNLIELVGSNDGSLVNAPIEIRVYS